ncbi:hypothetical protein [Roseivirga sp. E12]|uniref:hypothetical protein n=1 Tax=Roseivirga sp. E12 TaxID=2819237 RepID=UPI001ABCF504|nr:hypothetical protein [Roseivirga sp. E12]MBO3698771.1 hypothetical protein [Roseivirga sp. E12]
MKFNVKRAVFEFLSIVIAVILAMSLTEMRQNYLNRQLAEKSFSNIVDEIRENREGLIRDSARIAKDLDFIKKWIEDVKEKRKPEDFSAGFSLSFLNKAAMDVAQNNQSLNFISNERNMAISQIYDTQAFYQEHGAKTFEIMGDMSSSVISSKPEDLLPYVLRFRFHLGVVFNTVKAYLVESEDFLQNEALMPASD